MEVDPDPALEKRLDPDPTLKENRIRIRLSRKTGSGSDPQEKPDPTLKKKNKRIRIRHKKDSDKYYNRRFIYLLIQILTAYMEESGYRFKGNFWIRIKIRVLWSQEF